ncbi:MAG: UbiA family prenyltransferase [Verrucomicrobiota bacterium]|nr:UbiA family prenyltransferase [Verrucomicrobiota bacterium]
MTLDKIKNWLRLVRLPNLFTIPGDVFIGFFLATGGHYAGRGKDLFLLVIISLCIYAGGIILNDYCDIEKDAKKAPKRPLPSGAISKTTALIAIILLFIISLVTASSISLPTLLITSLLYLFIVFYNLWAKKIPVLGSIIMGCCRGLNVFLGASLFVEFFHKLVFTAALYEALYILIVTFLARNERKKLPKKFTAFFPVFVGLTLFAVLVKLIAIPSLFFLLFIFWITGICFRLSEEQNLQKVPEYIGRLLRALIIYQVCWLFILIPMCNIDAFICAWILLFMYPISSLISKHIASS